MRGREGGVLLVITLILPTDSLTKINDDKLSSVIVGNIDTSNLLRKLTR